MLKNLLESKKCFKLVCGAGNENASEVEKLVALYAEAGANYFDLSAREDVILSARKGLERVKDIVDTSQCFLNVSVGIKGDPHVTKAFIDEEKCISCGKCSVSCTVQEAISESESAYIVDLMKCIGCGQCGPVCPTNAISYQSNPKPLKEVLPPLIKLGLDSIELHAVSDDDEGIFEQWQEINSVFDGVLSLCTDRSHASDAQLKARISRALSVREPYTTIIQADGTPMGGTDDNASTTLQAIATAQIVQRSGFPVYLMLSGGTNSRTTELAQVFDVSGHGAALGSYARKIVKDYVDRDDFFTNKDVYEDALAIARNLVNKTMKYMGTGNNGDN